MLAQPRRAGQAGAAACRPICPARSDRTLAEDVVANAPGPATARARCATAGRCAADLTTDAGAYAPAPLPPAAMRIDVGQPLAGRCRCGDAARRGDGAQRRGAGAGSRSVPATACCRQAPMLRGGQTLMEAGRRLSAPAESRLLAAAGHGRARSRPATASGAALGRATPSSMPRSPASPMPSEPGAALP